MRFPTSARLPWALLAASTGAAVLTLFLVARSEPSEMGAKVVISLLIVALAAVGALIASRRPENPIGWIFCIGALTWIAGELALQYAVYALVTVPGTLPAGAWATWLGGWARGIGWFLIVPFLLLLFPTGRLSSARWRPVLWAAVGFIALFTIGSLSSPVSVDTRLEFVRHPLGWDLELMRLIAELAFMLSAPLLLACGAAAVGRFGRSTGDERQQLKWFAYAVGVSVALFVPWLSFAFAGLVSPSPAMWVVPLIGLPIAAGIAILKHRLYDIDLIINRTLVYGALSAILGLTYVTVVAGVSSLAGESELTVAAATLAVAALFQPLRSRVQSLIDRRFYRRKYDAARTVESFSSRLRNEVEIEVLTSDLLSVVRDTMQPTHVSIWIRP